MRNKGPKKNVTLSVDGEVYDEAKGMGIGVSRVLEEVLAELIESPMMSKEEMGMRRKLRMQRQLVFQRDLLLDEIQDIEEQLGDLGVEIQQQERLAERSKASQDRGKIIKGLNQVLQNCNYDEQIAWKNDVVQGMLKKLTDYDKIEWDMEKFVEHVNRLKKLTRISR